MAGPGVPPGVPVWCRHCSAALNWSRFLLAWVDKTRSRHCPDGRKHEPSR